MTDRFHTKVSTQTITKAFDPENGAITAARSKTMRRIGATGIIMHLGALILQLALYGAMAVAYRSAALADTALFVTIPLSIIGLIMFGLYKDKPKLKNKSIDYKAALLDLQNNVEEYQYFSRRLLNDIDNIQTAYMHPVTYDIWYPIHHIMDMNESLSPNAIEFENVPSGYYDYGRLINKGLTTEAEALHQASKHLQPDFNTVVGVLLSESYIRNDLVEQSRRETQSKIYAANPHLSDKTVAVLNKQRTSIDMLLSNINKNNTNLIEENNEIMKHVSKSHHAINSKSK